MRQIPDNRFQRDGDDLIEHVRIKLTDALSETKIDVPHLDGRILRVPLKEASSRLLLTTCLTPAQGADDVDASPKPVIDSYNGPGSVTTCVAIAGREMHF